MCGGWCSRFTHHKLSSIFCSSEHDSNLAQWFSEDFAFLIDLLNSCRVAGLDRGRVDSFMQIHSSMIKNLRIHHVHVHVHVQCLIKSSGKEFRFKCVKMSTKMLMGFKER